MRVGFYFFFVAVGINFVGVITDITTERFIRWLLADVTLRVILIIINHAKLLN